MPKPLLAQYAHWVGGEYDPLNNLWSKSFHYTEGELFNQLDDSLTVDYYAHVHMKLIAVNVTDQAMENMQNARRR